jgi:folylpolyglutamate synthase/dihydropteroate synthase
VRVLNLEGYTFDKKDSLLIKNSSCTMLLIKNKACVLSAFWLLFAAVLTKPSQSKAAAAAFAYHPVLEKEVDEDVSVVTLAQLEWPWRIDVQQTTRPPLTTLSSLFHLV